MRLRLQPLPFGGQLLCQVKMLCRVVHRQPQVLRVPRLRDVGEDLTFVDRTDDRGQIRITREQDTRRRVLIEAGEKLVPGHAGHALIGYYNRYFRLSTHDLQRILARLRFEHVELFAQQVFKGDQNLRLIVDQQHPALLSVRHACHHRFILTTCWAPPLIPCRAAPRGSSAHVA